MKTKRGKSGTGLRDYVKKSNSEEKMIKVINKQGETVFEKKSKIRANPNDYKPVQSRTERMLRPAEGSPYQKAIKKIMEKNEPSGRFSRADIELAKNKLKKRTGGATLKNPGKADLDKDGKLSGYEKKRGMAIEKSMSGKPMKAVGAKRGKFAKSGPRSEFGEYNKMRDLFDRQKKMQQRKKEMEKDKEKISEKKKGIAVKSGGMMKYNKGGGADTGKIGELKSKLAVAGDKFKKFKRDMKKKPRPKLQAPERKPMKPLKALGGGMMKYNKGGGADMGTKMSDKRREKIKEILRRLKTPRTINIKKEFKSGTTNPMQRDRKREGYRAKVEKSGGKVMFGDERGMKKFKNFMGGGMMNKPMGYKKGTMIMARGCKLGRKKATKIT